MSALSLEESTRLRHAIAIKPETTIRVLLIDLCSKHPDLAKSVFDSLCGGHLQRDSQRTGDFPGNFEGFNSVTMSAGRKRKSTSGRDSDSSSGSSTPDNVEYDTETMPTPKRLRLASSLDTQELRCEYCFDPFTISSSKKDECTYHTGEMDVYDEDDFWADTWEETWGPHDSDENRLNFPDGFMWSCCNKKGDEAGCCIGRHVPLRGKLYLKYAQLRASEALGI